MAEVKTKQRNCSVDLFRYIAALMVVAIHTHPFVDINTNLGFVFTEMVTRIGVPFFFGIAGYFYIQKLESGQKVFWSYIKRLLTTYSLWTVLYYALDFVQYGHKDIGAFIRDGIFYYFVSGSRGHFWFFPAIIYSVCLITLLYKAGAKKWIIPLGILCYLVGSLGSTYYTLGVQIPVLGQLFRMQEWVTFRRILLTGFPCMGGGYLVYLLQKRVSDPRKITIAWIGTTLLWLGEVVVVKVLGLYRDVVTPTFLYLHLITTLLFLLCHPMPKAAALANRCRVTANFTYYSHPFVIICINTLSGVVLGRQFSETIMCLLTIGICTVAGLIICKWNNKFINHFV